MTKNVSTNEITNCEDYLNNIVNNLSSSFEAIQTSLNNINVNINILKSYSGLPASSVKERIINENNKKIVEYYQKKWNIQVTNDKSAYDFLLSESFNSFEDNILKLQENSNLLGIAAQTIEKIISEITTMFGGKVDEQLFITGGFIEYLKNYETISNLSKIDLTKIKQDGYIIQGITIIDGEVLITSYSKKDGEKSRIYLYEQSGNLKGTIILNNEAHVGGITYDKDNGVIFVSGGNGNVNAYSYKSLKDQFVEGCTSIDLNDKQLDLGDIIINTTGLTVGLNGDEKVTTVGKASTLYFYDNSLYVSTFNGAKDGEMVKFNLEFKNGEIYAIIEEKYSIPPRTQGIAITEYNGQQYLISTQSIGVTNSIVTMSEINNGNLNEIGSMEIQASGLQGVSIDEENNVAFSYENYNGVTGIADTIIDLAMNRNEQSISTTTFEALKEQLEQGTNKSFINEVISDATGIIYNKTKNIPNE